MWKLAHRIEAASLAAQTEQNPHLKLQMNTFYLVGLLRHEKSSVKIQQFCISSNPELRNKHNFKLTASWLKVSLKLI